MSYLILKMRQALSVLMDSLLWPFPLFNLSPSLSSPAIYDCYHVLPIVTNPFLFLKHFQSSSCPSPFSFLLAVVTGFHYATHVILEREIYAQNY